MRRTLGPEPKYANLFRRHGQVPRIEIERTILRLWDWEAARENEGVGKYGRPWSEHFLDYCAMLFPKRIQHEWMVLRVTVLEEALLRRRKIINWIGSQNSGKSDDMATIGIALMTIDPEYSRGFLAGPYKKAADAVTWGRFMSRRDEAKQVMGRDLLAKDFATKERIIFKEGEPEAGYVELITLDKAGRLQGLKSKDQNRGFLMVFADEIAEFETKGMLDLLDNLASNQNLLVITGCNFTDENNLAGDLCAPEGRSYRDLDPDVDFQWDSYMDSITVRFDGHQSPNVLAGKNLYPFLIGPDRIAAMARAHTTEGPRYMAQIRSFPSTVEGKERVLTTDQIRAGGCYERYSLEPGRSRRILALDPGFGGDSCVAQAFDFGPGQVSTVDGRMVNSQIFRPVSSPIEIPIEAAKEADAEWISRLRRAAGPNSAIGAAPERTVDVNQQIAVKTFELMQELEVDRDMLVYDGSLRAGIVHAIVSIIGPESTAINSHGAPTDRVASPIGERADDIYVNLTTEYHFAFQSLVLSGQLRDAAKMPAALEQMCRRVVNTKGSKRQIETKREFKRNNKNKSPNESDCAVIGLEKARREGFDITHSLRQKSTKSYDPLAAAKAIASAIKGKKFQSKRLKT